MDRLQDTLLPSEAFPSHLQDTIIFQIKTLCFLRMFIDSAYDHALSLLADNCCKNLAVSVKDRVSKEKRKSDSKLLLA